MAKCEICGKAAGYGSKVSHSKRHANRAWMPNVHRKRIMLLGEMTRVSICTRCQRTLRKTPA